MKDRNKITKVPEHLNNTPLLPEDMLPRKSMQTKTHSIEIEESILGEGYKLIIQDLNNKYGTVEVDLDDEELNELSEVINAILKIKAQNTMHKKALKSIEDYIANHCEIVSTESLLMTKKNKDKN